ncbi:22146_t:CDS:1, partial [Racocetra persica]
SLTISGYLLSKYRVMVDNEVSGAYLLASFTLGISLHGSQTQKPSLCTS